MSHGYARTERGSFSPTIGGILLPAAAASYSIPAGNGVAVTPTQSVEYAIPVMFSAIPGACTYIGVNVTSAVAASAARLGIRADAGLDIPFPGALITDAGTVATTGTGWKEVAITDLLVPYRLYWLTLTSQGGAPSYTGINASGWGVVSTTNPAALALNCYTQTGVTGALPADFTSSVGTNQGPRICLKF